MDKRKGLKLLGLVATIGGIGISLLNSFVSEKQLDEKIERKTMEAVAKLTEKGE